MGGRSRWRVEPSGQCSPVVSCGCVSRWPGRSGVAGSPGASSRVSLAWSLWSQAARAPLVSLRLRSGGPQVACPLSTRPSGQDSAWRPVNARGCHLLSHLGKVGTVHPGTPWALALPGAREAPRGPGPGPLSRPTPPGVRSTLCQYRGAAGDQERSHHVASWGEAWWGWGLVLWGSPALSAGGWLGRPSPSRDASRLTRLLRPCSLHGPRTARVSSTLRWTLGLDLEVRGASHPLLSTRLEGDARVQRTWSSTARLLLESMRNIKGLLGTGRSPVRRVPGQGTQGRVRPPGQGCGLGGRRGDVAQRRVQGAGCRWAWVAGTAGATRLHKKYQGEGAAQVRQPALYARSCIYVEVFKGTSHVLEAAGLGAVARAAVLGVTGSTGCRSGSLPSGTKEAPCRMAAQKERQRLQWPAGGSEPRHTRQGAEGPGSPSRERGEQGPETEPATARDGALRPDRAHPAPGHAHLPGPARSPRLTARPPRPPTSFPDCSGESGRSGVRHPTRPTGPAPEPRLWAQSRTSRPASQGVSPWTRPAQGSPHLCEALVSPRSVPRAGFKPTPPGPQKSGDLHSRPGRGLWGPVHLPPQERSPS